MTRPSLALAIFLLASSSAEAFTTAFRVWGSPLLYMVPTEKYGEPIVGKLENGGLIIHVLTYASSSAYFDDASGKVIVEGNEIVLCYKEHPVVHQAGRPMAAVLYTVALEYTISGLPNRNYSFRVNRQCK
jgi:hypothetical protein